MKNPIIKTYLLNLFKICKKVKYKANITPSNYQK